MIPNPTPVTATFNGMWIQNARFMFSSNGARVDARVSPYDPETKNLLSTGSKEVRKHITNELANTIEQSLKDLAETDREIRMVHVSAHDPNKPVLINVMFAEGRPHSIRDAFQLAAANPAFAEILNDVMEFIAA